MNIKVVDIEWDVDVEEGYKVLDSMPAKEASEALGIPFKTYSNMTTEERHDYAYDSWRHNRTSLSEFVGAPNEVEIPNPEDPAWNEDTISDYVSEETGWCHHGFKVVYDRG